MHNLYQMLQYTKKTILKPYMFPKLWYQYEFISSIMQHLIVKATAVLIASLKDVLSVAGGYFIKRKINPPYLRLFCFSFFFFKRIILTDYTLYSGPYDVGLKTCMIETKKNHMKINIILQEDNITELLLKLY